MLRSLGGLLVIAAITAGVTAVFILSLSKKVRSTVLKEVKKWRDDSSR